MQLPELRKTTSLHFKFYSPLSYFALTRRLSKHASLSRSQLPVFCAGLYCSDVPSSHLSCSDIKSDESHKNISLPSDGVTRFYTPHLATASPLTMTRLRRSHVSGRSNGRDVPLLHSTIRQDNEGDNGIEDSIVVLGGGSAQQKKTGRSRGPRQPTTNVSSRALGPLPFHSSPSKCW